MGANEFIQIKWLAVFWLVSVSRIFTYNLMKKEKEPKNGE